MSNPKDLPKPINPQNRHHGMFLNPTHTIPPSVTPTPCHGDPVASQGKISPSPPTRSGGRRGWVIAFAVVIMILIPCLSAFANDLPEMDLPIDYKHVLEEMNKIPEEEEEPLDPEEESDPPHLFGDDFPSTRSVTFVIDKSGSMGSRISSFVEQDGTVHFNISRFEMCKLELLSAIRALSSNFEFNVIAYSCSSYPALFQKPRKVTEKTIAQAEAWVETLNTTGSTGTAQAVLKAIALGERDMVILLSDGAPNCSLSSSQHIDAITTGRKEARVSTIGIGVQSGGRTEMFLQKVAANCQGSYTFVSE